jgi:hypothetical protein
MAQNSLSLFRGQFIGYKGKGGGEDWVVFAGKARVIDRRMLSNLFLPLHLPTHDALCYNYMYEM